MTSRGRQRDREWTLVVHTAFRHRLCLYWSCPYVSSRLLDSSAAPPSELWVGGDHASPAAKHIEHQVMAEGSRSWGASPPAGHLAEAAASSPGCGGGTEGQEHHLSQAGDEEQQRTPSAAGAEDSHNPPSEGGSCSNSREAPHPGEDPPPPQPQPGLIPGGREDSQYLATAAGQHSMVPPHHSFPPLFFTTLLYQSFPPLITTFLYSSPPLCSTTFIHNSSLFFSSTLHLHFSSPFFSTTLPHCSSPPLFSISARSFSGANFLMTIILNHLHPGGGCG